MTEQIKKLRDLLLDLPVTILPLRYSVSLTRWTTSVMVTRANAMVTSVFTSSAT